jgi:charged multivesicular body protein 3
MFGKKKPNPQEMAKEWKASVRAQKRGVERQIRHVELEEQKVKASVKQLVRSGNQGAAMPMIQTLVQSKKARSKMLMTCVQLDSLIREIDLQMGQMKVMGCFQKSVEVTKLLNSMMKLPELQATVMSLQKEMGQAGMVAEMMDDTLDQMNGDAPEDEELAVRLMYNEIAGEVSKQTGQAVTTIPVSPEEIAADPKAAALVAH